MFYPINLTELVKDEKSASILTLFMLKGVVGIPIYELLKSNKGLPYLNGSFGYLPDEL